MKFGTRPVRPCGKIALILFLGLAVSTVHAQQVIKICALRVDFQPDQNLLTTGDGLFLFDSSQVNFYTVDPPPHNRSYFQDQILSVDNYFQSASKGIIQVNGTVFPREQNGAYRLPHDMGYYNPNTTADENNRQLAQLFIDALSAADQDADIHFGDFDLVTIFHAGVGKDIDFGYDATPQDLPSLYLNSDFFSAALDTVFNGIAVDEGVTKIDRGMILPETESQEGVEVAITGIFASNIGNYLGLYDLFSPSTQKSGIGRFGLMDVGLFNLYGLVPAIPCAYSRKLLGWDTAEILSDPRDTVNVNRFNGTGSSGTTLYQIPINNDEYYLIEYRGDNSVRIDSLYAVLAESRPVLPTYLEVLKTYYPEAIEVSDSTGVLLKIKDYDWGLPGAGILIWHIDESVITAKADLNAINDDRDNRGVDLEEADGSQDIGYEYTILEPGYQSEQGTWLDFWFSGNPAPLYRNEFSPGSTPNTLTNRVFANSHITLNNFSANGENRMSFSFRRDYFETGFPIDLNGLNSAGAFTDLLSVPCTGFAGPLVFTTDDSGRVSAFTAGGTGMLAADRHVVAEMLRRELPSISFADQNGDQQADLLLACTKSGLVQGFTLEDLNGDLLLDTLFSRRIDQNFTTPPVVQYPYFYIGLQNNQVYRFTLSGVVDSIYYFNRSVNGLTVISAAELIISSSTADWQSFPPAVLDLNSDGRLDQLFFENPAKIIIELQGLSGAVNEVELPGPAIAAPSFGDADADGFYEIFFNLADRVYGLHYNGAALTNFPIQPALLAGEHLQGTPLLFDADGDQHTDIVTCTSLGQILAFNLQGRLLPGFPLSAGGNPAGSPLAVDYDADDQVELFLSTTSGNVFAWQLEATAADKIWWQQSIFNYTHNNYLTNILPARPPAAQDLLPAGSVYNYPNPNTADYTLIRYYLREDARVQIRIFDLAGDQVDNFSGPGLGQQHNEVRWDLAPISSGVYLCRVEANSDQTRQVRLIKILVIK
jgi:M6 family metalloprotease-like protein